MRTELSGIPVFTAVVECGNFARAAARLHLTRSAVSKTIARLEERLGAALFQRTTRRLILTEEGEIFYQQSRQALDCIRDAEDEINRGKEHVQGRLRISLPVLFGRNCVAPILFTLARRYPQLRLELSFSDRQVNLFEEGFDLAIRIGELADSGSLKARPLGHHNMVLCASAAYLRTHPAPQTIDELGEHPAIGYLHNGTLQHWRLKNEQGIRVDFRPATVMSADDFSAISQAVNDGLGIAWLPDWLVAREIALGQLQVILPESASERFTISAVWPQAPWLPQKIRVTLDALVARLPEQMADGGLLNNSKQ